MYGKDRAYFPFGKIIKTINDIYNVIFTTVTEIFTTISILH